MSKEKILIIDDDKNTCEMLKTFLEKENFTVIISNDSKDAMVKFYAMNSGIVLLDVTIPSTDGWQMPNMDGWQICKEIRKVSDVPVIIITAKGEIFDKVLGLELGADDYIVKPFDPKELLARIKAVSRRYLKMPPVNRMQEIVFDKLSINLTRYVLKVDGNVVDAPPKEIELLYCLASHPNTVFTRDQLLDNVWGFDYYGDSRTVDVHIRRLRAKLGNISGQWKLTTVWGVGYKFTLHDTAE